MLRRFGPTQRVLAAAVVAYAAAFVLFIAFEQPGLGIGHGFYVGIILAALATGPLAGAIAGVVAAAVYAVAVVLNPRFPAADVPTLATVIRLLAYVLVGTILGHYAATTRRLLEELRLLAGRDRLTGLPNTRGFEEAITRRIAERTPFTLLVTDAAKIPDDADRPAALLDLADRMRRLVPPAADVARIGDAEFGVLVPGGAPDDAARIAGALERALPVTFGWASYPRDGENGLALLRAADERLYARKIVRGEWSSAPVEMRAS